MTLNKPDDPANFAHVLWIGGSPCAGKSSITERLTSLFSLSAYSCDDAFDRHCAELAPDSATCRFILQGSHPERLELPIDVQVELEFTAYREQFPLIQRDIARIGAPVLAEGAALLPELLGGQNIPRNRALWIVPTEMFQRTMYRKRDWAWSMLAAEPDPEVLFDRWMQRDALFAKEVVRRARDLGYHVIVIDGTRPIVEILQEVIAHFDVSHPSA